MREFTKVQLEILDSFETFSPSVEDDFLKPPYDDTLISHYTSASGLLGILGNGNLRFTEYAYLNDNTEGTYIFDFLEYCLHKNNHCYSQDFISAVFHQLEKVPFNDIYDINCMYYFLCCFSSNSDSLTMWNYYTKTSSKAGYNIRFSYKDLHSDIISLHSSNGFYFEGYKVMYLPEEQEKFLYKLLDYVYCEWNKDANRFIIRVFLNYLNSVRFAFKHIAFEPEQEIRFVIKLNRADELIKFFDKDGIIVPYIEVPFRKNDVKAIILSPLVKEKTAVESIDLLLDKYGYKHNVKISPSNIPLRY